MAFYCPRCGRAADQAGTCVRDGAMLVEVAPHDLVGQTVGEYTVETRLGHGAFGHVYRAVHARSGLVVALKLLDQPIDAADSQRAITEARAAAAIEHANVVRVYDLGLTPDRRPYIVMEHLAGTPLARLWNRRVPLADVLPVATAILRGLAAAHRLGIVHRDLKPENVFVAGDRVVIVDFGLAKLLADPRAPNLTATGASLGTPRYMSPEQIRGQPVDGRTDLYALGVMIYEALAGAPPFDASSTFQLFDAHVHARPPLGQLPREVPPHVVDVIDRALAKDPADRFADADAMRRALAGGAGAPRSMVTRRRWWPYAAAAVAVAGVATIAVVASHGSHDTAPALPPPPSGPQQLKLDTRDPQVRMLEDALARKALSLDQLRSSWCAYVTARRRMGNARDPDVARAAAQIDAVLAVLRTHFPGFDETTCFRADR